MYKIIFNAIDSNNKLDLNTFSDLKKKYPNYLELGLKVRELGIKDINLMFPNDYRLGEFISNFLSEN